MGDVVFNELLWMGSDISPYDEYMELRNMTDTPVDFSTAPWTVYREGEFMFRIDDGVLPAHGLFLILRRNPAESAVDSPVDFVSNMMVLTNSNTDYALYAGLGDTSPLIDVADDGVGPSMSGRYIPSERIRWSMERNEIPGDGSIEANWHVACLSMGFIAGSNLRGTPGYPNYKNIPPASPTDLTISPDYIANDSSIHIEAVGTYDPDSIPNNLKLYFDWFREDSFLFTSVDSIFPFNSNFACSLTTPGYNYSVCAYAFDGTDSAEIACSDTISVHFEKGELIINELAWAGSMRSRNDEWIELKNNSSHNIDFSQTPFDIRTLPSTGDETEPMITIDHGILDSGDFFLISNFADTNPLSALDISPNFIDEDVALSNGRLYLELRDFPGRASSIIDLAGDSLAPFYGLNNPSDSTRYSMARKAIPGDGCDSTNWFTSEVSIGFKEYSLERGSPGSRNIRNSPPELQFAGIEGYTTDGLEPQCGTKDTFFVWRVKYVDADNQAPEYLHLLFDQNCDSDFEDSGEIIDMYREDYTDDNFTDGVIYKCWKIGLSPNPLGCPYTFRASDGLATCALGIPALDGPIVEATPLLTILGTIWRPDTVIAEPYIFTSPMEMPFLFHTGDVPIQVGLSIAQADIYPHTNDTFAYSSGGWIYGHSVDTSGINLYKLSALIIPGDETVEPDDFNDANEDILTGEIKWFDRDTLGRPSDSLITNIIPGEVRRLAFKLDFPESVYGFHSTSEHIIKVRLYMRMPLP